MGRGMGRRVHQLSIRRSLEVHNLYLKKDDEECSGKRTL